MKGEEGHVTKPHVKIDPDTERKKQNKTKHFAVFSLYGQEN